MLFLLTQSYESQPLVYDGNCGTNPANVLDKYPTTSFVVDSATNPFAMPWVYQLVDADPITGLVDYYDSIWSVVQLNSAALQPPVIVQRKTREHSSYKSFKTAQKSGLIKLADMTAIKGTLEDKELVVLGKGNEVSRSISLRYSRVGPRVPLYCNPSSPEYISKYVGDFAVINKTLDTLRVSQGTLSVGNLRATIKELESYTTLFTKYGRPSFSGLFDYLETLSPSGSLHNSALADVRSGIYDASIDILESNETRKFLLQQFRSIFKLAKRLKKGSLNLSPKQLKKAAKRLPEDQSDIFMTGIRAADKAARNRLMFRYAVSPILYSIQDAMEALLTPPRVYVTSRKREDIPFSITHKGYQFEGTAEVRVFAKAQLDTSYGNNNIGINWLNALWDVTPGSFIVDWVFPVGDFLMAAVVPDCESQIRTFHSVTVRDVSVKHLTSGESVASKLRYYRGYKAPSTLKWDFMPKPDINSARKLDALALAWTLLRAGGKP